MKRLVVVLVASVVAACSTVPRSEPVKIVDYVCDGGKGFAVTYLPEQDRALIDIEGSRFRLQAESADGAEQRFGCDVLTLSRRAALARVDMQGEHLYENCRARN
ncbi:hypothetical protein [Azoarcus sp. KH32C]|uniref:hypothetical protein n=1 Tax=Azoarcus sp. KH32C TaxID=748247 RepID=UPI0002386760|nr:hypothetical protein [Azoarcus sp. KH32C]BAL25292.1 hypothetical protein AZKH_2993 [Azoarcus sp. KH32C]